MKHMSMVMASGVILAIIIGIVGIAAGADDLLYPKSMLPSEKFNSSQITSMQPSKGFNSSQITSMQPSKPMFKL